MPVTNDYTVPMLKRLLRNCMDGRNAKCRHVRNSCRYYAQQHIRELRELLDRPRRRPPCRTCGCVVRCEHSFTAER